MPGEHSDSDVLSMVTDAAYCPVVAASGTKVKITAPNGRVRVGTVVDLGWVAWRWEADDLPAC